MSKEFKIQAIKEIINICKELISTKFDKKDTSKGQKITINNNNYSITIKRNCFPDHLSYFEDYYVDFNGRIQNQKIWTDFYLEWKNNEIETELIPACITRNPMTGNDYNRNIIINMV